MASDHITSDPLITEEDSNLALEKMKSLKLSILPSVNLYTTDPSSLANSRKDQDVTTSSQSTEEPATHSEKTISVVRNPSRRVRAPIQKPKPVQHHNCQGSKIDDMNAPILLNPPQDSKEIFSIVARIYQHYALSEKTDTDMMKWFNAIQDSLSHVWIAFCYHLRELWTKFDYQDKEFIIVTVSEGDNCTRPDFLDGVLIGIQRQYSRQSATEIKRREMSLEKIEMQYTSTLLTLENSVKSLTGILEIYKKELDRATKTIAERDYSIKNTRSSSALSHSSSSYESSTIPETSHVNLGPYKIIIMPTVEKTLELFQSQYPKCPDSIKNFLVTATSSGTENFLLILKAVRSDVLISKIKLYGSTMPSDFPGLITWITERVAN